MIQIISKGKSAAAEFTASLPSLLSFITDDKRQELSFQPGEIVAEAMYENKMLDLM